MRPRQTPQGREGRSSAWSMFVIIFVVLYTAGYGLGFLTKDMIFSSTAEDASSPGGVLDDSTQTSRRELRIGSTTKKAGPKWAGDTIHSVLTSSGDHYQNYQTRIMYSTYKLVQQMPGGDKLTGFTRILHRTVPDILMEEVPTFLAKPLKPQCDGWCDYPVANRPNAIQQFFDALAANESMIQGAWIFMLECDYVWIKPMKAPGSAWDPAVPGAQFYYDYIIPTHPNAVPSMKKLYPGKVEDIPCSGPAPVLLRFNDWRTIVKDYVRLSAQMEADEEMKKALEWVREMYAWDAAAALHKDTIKIITTKPPNSTTIVQPPFDEGMGEACLCHYTWGALYHEGLPSKGAKQVYRYEKRDYNDLKYVLKVPAIKMPPEYKDGWILEFDAPLNRKRHDLVVVMLSQMNRGIATLPDLTDHWHKFEPQLQEYIRQRDAAAARDAADKAAASQKV